MVVGIPFVGASGTSRNQVCGVRRAREHQNAVIGKPQERPAAAAEPLEWPEAAAGPLERPASTDPMERQSTPTQCSNARGAPLTSEQKLSGITRWPYNSCSPTHCATTAGQGAQGCTWSLASKCARRRAANSAAYSRIWILEEAHARSHERVGVGIPFVGANGSPHDQVSGVRRASEHQAAVVGSH